MSRGSVVTPSSPTSWANGFPRFGLICPPATVIHPKRTSFSIPVPKMRVWLNATLRVFVVNERPNPGTSAS